MFRSSPNAYGFDRSSRWGPLIHLSYSIITVVSPPRSCPDFFELWTPANNPEFPWLNDRLRHRADLSRRRCLLLRLEQT
jgi:hypothetical protein